MMKLTTNFIINKQFLLEKQGCFHPKIKVKIRVAVLNCKNYIYMKSGTAHYFVSIPKGLKMNMKAIDVVICLFV